MKKLLAALALLLLPAFTMPVYAANTASISLSASPSSVQQNSNTTITVTGNTGGGVTDGVEVKITYDTAKLTYVSGSINYSGSPLNSEDPTTSIANGTILLKRYTNAPPGPTGSFKIATFELKAVPNSGSAPISVDLADSFVSDHANSGANMLGSVSGTSVSFTPIPAAVVVTPSSGGSSASNTTTTKRVTAAPVNAATTPVKVTPGESQTPDPGEVAAVPVTTSLKEESKNTAAVITPTKANTRTPLLIGATTLAVVLVAAGILFWRTKKSSQGAVVGVPLTTAATSEPDPIVPPAPEASVELQQPEAVVVQPQMPEATIPESAPVETPAPVPAPTLTPTVEDVAPTAPTDPNEPKA